MSNTSARIGPLDGMRTVAILLVLIFHLNEKYLTGGFVGVDVFFVISGYIITRNIITEMEEGRFSLPAFYWRRATRLVPAAVATIVVSLFAASFVYSPAVLQLFGETAFFAATWTVNVFFWGHSAYWDAESQSNIFLHMWSLSVEEQFYLIWPVLVALILSRSRHVASVFAAVSVLGAAAAIVIFAMSPAFAFYMVPARIFQFAIGAAVATAHLRYPRNFLNSSDLPNSMMFAVGMAGVGLAAYLADGNAYNIWVAAVLPTAGAAMAIFAMNSFLGRTLLAPKPIQCIGRRAYSLYLVHWPLMVMASIFYGVDKPFIVDTAILLSCFVAGELLFRFVEDPFRIKAFPTKDHRRKASTVALGALSILVAGHFWILSPIVQGGTEQVGSGSYVQAARALWKDRSSLGNASMHCTVQWGESFESYNQKDCLLGPEPKKILILGDSTGSETYIMLSQIFDPKRLVVAGGSGCEPIFPEPGSTNRRRGCQDINRARFDWIDRPDVTAIVLTSNWMWWNPAVIDSTLDRLAQTGKPVIVMGVRPRFSNEVPKLLDSAAWRVARQDLTPYLTFSIGERAAQVQESIGRQGAAFHYVPIEKYLCPSKCPALHDDGTLVYLDQIHLTAQAAVDLGKQIAQKEGANLKALVDHAPDILSSILP